MWVRSLAREDSLEKEMATHPLQYSRLGNPMHRRAWQAVVHGFARIRYNLVIKQNNHMTQYKYILRRNENTWHHKNLDINFYGIITRNGQKVEIKIPIHWQMDKQNVIYTYNGILFSHKEWNTDTCNNTGWTLKIICSVKEARHKSPNTWFPKGRKPGTTAQIHTLMKWPEYDKFTK